MIDEVMAELGRILHHTKEILERQVEITEVGKSASQIEHSILKLLGREKQKTSPECGYLFRHNGWDGIVLATAWNLE